MKIWFDALTPKQLLIYEYMIRRASRKHHILFTSRDYTEVVQLANIRGLNPRYVGRFGGSDLGSKLTASLDRSRKLVGLVEKFAPDISVSSCSPEASRISYGLGIPHIGFCNAPHAKAVCRLSIPFLSRLLIPHHIPKDAFLEYGIDKSAVIQYQALDEYLIVNNPPALWDAEAAGLTSGKKTILFRTYETQASYPSRNINVNNIIGALVERFPNCNVVVLGRYPDQIRSLRAHNDSAIVLPGTADSGAILSKCDLFVGSGGTMTTEAVLRGVPTISYEAVPNRDEAYLVERNLLVRTSDVKGIVEVADRLLHADPQPYRNNARMLLSAMEDPYHTLESEINSVLLS